MNAFEIISDYFTSSATDSTEVVPSSSNDSLKNDSDNESECSNSSLEGFESVDYKVFDLWDDHTNDKKPRRKRAKKQDESSKDEDCKALVVYQGPFDPNGEFVYSLNHNEPSDKTFHINPEVIQLIMSTLDKPVASTSEAASSADSMALVPWQPTKMKRQVSKRQVIRYRGMYVQARRRISELRKELAVTEDTLELKTWLLESLGEELKHAKHDSKTLEKANETLYKNNKSLQKSLIEQSKLAVNAATAAAKASVVKTQSEEFCKDIMALNENIWNLKEEKRQLENQRDAMSTEMSELKAFVNTMQADLDNLIMNLVSKGMVLATDSNGKKITLARLNVPIEESNWSSIKTRRDEVRYMAIISGHEANLEKMNARVMDLLTANDNLQNEKEELRVTVKDCEDKISELEDELAAEKCMGRMMCSDLEDAQQLIDSLRDSKDRTESLLNKEKKRNAELERELLRCEKQLLARVDSLEHAMEASKLVKKTQVSNKARTAEQFAQTSKLATQEFGAQAFPTKVDQGTQGTSLSFRPNAAKKPVKRLSSKENLKKALVPFGPKTFVESLTSSCMRKALEMTKNCWDINTEQKKETASPFVFNDSLPESSPAHKWVMEEMLLSAPKTKQPKASSAISAVKKTKAKKTGRKTLVATLVAESLNPEAQELEKAQLVLAEAPEQSAKKPRMSMSSESEETLFGDLFKEPEAEPKKSKSAKRKARKANCNVSWLAELLDKRESQGSPLCAPVSDFNIDFFTPSFAKAPVVKPFEENNKSCNGLIHFEEIAPKTKVMAVPEVAPVGRDSLMDLDLDALFGSSPFDFAPLEVKPTPSSDLDIAPTSSELLKLNKGCGGVCSWKDCSGCSATQARKETQSSVSWTEWQKEIDQFLIDMEEEEDQVYSLESLFEEATSAAEKTRPKKSSKGKDKAKHASRFNVHGRQSAGRPYQVPRVAQLKKETKKEKKQKVRRAD